MVLFREVLPAFIHVAVIEIDIMPYTDACGMGMKEKIGIYAILGIPGLLMAGAFQTEEAKEKEREKEESVTKEVKSVVSFGWNR